LPGSGSGGSIGLVIEYFGLEGDANYDAQMVLKRQYWSKKEDWILVEYTQHDVAVGRDVFLRKVKKDLLAHGKVFAKLSEEEIWLRVRHRAVDSFSKTVASFVSRCRQQSLSLEKLELKISNRSDLSPVETKFLELAKAFYGAYLEKLQETGEEDFEGLLQRAAEEIRSGKSSFDRKDSAGDISDLRYVFVDEYQDFSELFSKLVGAIKSCNNEIEFCCVGDDWQAINGFAGSDLKYYKNFSRYFPKSKEISVSRNYRSKEKIVSLSNNLMFGFGNFAIATKEKRGAVKIGKLNQFVPTSAEKDNYQGNKITPAVLRLLSVVLSGDGNVVLLSRTNSVGWYTNVKPRNSGSPPSIEELCEEIRSKFPEDLRGRISVSTVHKYKGLQSDVVILLDAKQGRFPSLHPNWVFTRALGDSLQELIAAERRLFYVAMTRAVDTLVLLTDEIDASPFLEAIEDSSEIEDINWADYSFEENNLSSSYVTVHIGNVGDRGGTFPIKDELKSNGYQWDAKEKVWKKRLLNSTFESEQLTNSVWGTSADNVYVHVLDWRSKSLEKYTVSSGRWKENSG